LLTLKLIWFSPSLLLAFTNCQRYYGWIRPCIVLRYSPYSFAACAFP